MHLSPFFFCNISPATVFADLLQQNSNFIMAGKTKQKRTLTEARERKERKEMCFTESYLES